MTSNWTNREWVSVYDLVCHIRGDIPTEQMSKHLLASLEEVEALIYEKDAPADEALTNLEE